MGQLKKIRWYNSIPSFHVPKYTFDYICIYRYNFIGYTVRSRTRVSPTIGLTFKKHRRNRALNDFLVYIKF